MPRSSWAVYFSLALASCFRNEPRGDLYAHARLTCLNGLRGRTEEGVVEVVRHAGMERLGGYDGPRGSMRAYVPVWDGGMPTWYCAVDFENGVATTSTIAPMN